MRIFLLAAFLLYTTAVTGQTTVSGVVKSKDDGKGMPGLSVSIKDKKSAAIITYALTDETGKYHLNFNNGADSLTITVSGFNVAKQTRNLSNRSQTISFELSSEAIALKEIKINQPKIRKLSDTINYMVDGFKDKNDRTIADVLKKMPGIEVKDDGTILYNNKPINKFYIEDQDLLQGRYGIATNNIEAKDVASVQVLENHQPVKALKNREFSDEPALNIRLKDSAKGVLVASGKLGAGLSPFLWNNELFSMYFNKGRQNMNTYKGNNSGEDPGSDLTSYYTDVNRQTGGIGLAVQAPATPAISRKRYLFNRAHAFTINNLWTIGKDNQVNANISYLDDRQQKSSFSRSVYYLPADSLLTIEEQLASIESVHQLDASFKLNKNKSDYYLDNTFNLKGKWNQTAGSVMNTDTVFQNLNTPLYAVNNTLNLIKNYQKYSLKIYSYTAYSHTPQTLSVQPLLYDSLFSGLADPVAMRQQVTIDQFVSNSRLSFGSTQGVWKQNYTAGFNANLQQLQSALQAQNAAGELGTKADSLQNRLQWNKYELYFNPSFSYAKNKFKSTLSFPLSFYALQTNNRVTGQDKNISRLFLNPSLYVNYDFNLFLALVARAEYNQDIGALNNVFTGYIMQSYRSLLRNDGQLPEKQNQNYTLDLNYRHPLHAIFINLGTSYSRNRTNLMYGDDYLGILNLRKTYNLPNIIDNFMVHGKISKGIDAISGNVTLELSYSHTGSNTISQAQVVDFKNNAYLVKPAVFAKLKTWASLNYNFQFTQSKNTIKNESRSFAPIRSNSQFTQLNLFPAEGLTINLAHEYFYSSAIAAGNRVMNFADAGAKYRYKTMEFGVNYNNIFNVKQYISASYNSTSTYYSAYNLRPAQVMLTARFKIK